MLPAGMLITDDLVLGFEWNLVGYLLICLFLIGSPPPLETGSL